MENSPTKECQNCHSRMFGFSKFCSNCGHKLSNNKHVHWIFIDTFLKFSEIAHYVKKYYKTILSPTKLTINSYENETLNDALKFLEFSAGIYIILFLSRFISINGQDFISSILVIVYLITTLLVNFYIFYHLCKRSRYAKKTSYINYIEFTCLFLGFTLPIIAVFQWIQVAINELFGAIATLIVLIPLYIYMLRVWKYFWGGISKWGIFWRLVLSVIFVLPIQILLLSGITLINKNITKKGMRDLSSTVKELDKVTKLAEKLLQKYENEDSTEYHINWVQNELGNKTKLQVLLPDQMTDNTSEVPKIMDYLTTQYVSRKCSLNKGEFNITTDYYEYIQYIDNNFINETLRIFIENAKNNSEFQNLKYKIYSLDIDGISGKKIVGFFSNNNIPLKFSLIFFSDQHDMWSIHIFYHDTAWCRSMVNKIEDSITFN